MSWTSYIYDRDLKAYCINDPILDLLPYIAKTDPRIIRDSDKKGYRSELVFYSLLKESKERILETHKDLIQSLCPNSFWDTPQTALNIEVIKERIQVIWKPSFTVHKENRLMFLQPDYIVWSDTYMKWAPEGTKKLSPPKYLAIRMGLLRKMEHHTIKDDPLFGYHSILTQLDQEYLDSIQKDILGYDIDPLDNQLSLADLRRIPPVEPNLAQNALDWAHSVAEKYNENYNVDGYPQKRPVVYPTVEDVITKMKIHPNMKNTMDFPWHDAKNLIAKEYASPTQMWFCSWKTAEKWTKEYVKDDEIASWKHPQFTAKNLGLPEIIHKPFEAILEVNRHGPLMRFPSTANLPNCPEDTFEIFLDFESVTSFGNPGVKLVTHFSPCIFCIGVGWGKLSNLVAGYQQWNFESFFLEKDQTEVDLISQFIDKVESLASGQSKSKIRVYHWSIAEKTFLRSAMRRHSIDSDFVEKVKRCLYQWEWMDLENHFRSHCIVVQGALNYKLKSIAASMFKGGCIWTNWSPHSHCGDGLTAMTTYIRYREGRIERDDYAIADVLYYNEIDCKVMWDIVKFLRH